MGGRLTVSSKEHCGSTFTFILPYKVSIACDNPDDSDEISDAEDNDSASDDIFEGFFQFQPPTLGSLFSSNSNEYSKVQNLLPQKIGCTTSRKFNGFSENSSYSFPTNNNIRSKGTASIEDASSVIDGSEISESVCSSSCSAETENKNVVNREISQNGSADSSYRATNSMESQQTSQNNKEREKTTSQCSGTSEEVATPEVNPKILLVEDNKINVMVTQSMMKQLGHNIDVVNNGVEAVRAVQRQSYDLILMVLSGFLQYLDSLPLHAFL